MAAAYVLLNSDAGIRLGPVLPPVHGAPPSSLDTTLLSWPQQGWGRICQGERVVGSLGLRDHW